jgi:TPP-dependent pyruvate/acetoin dehydrogenase alpha subunit
MSGPLREELAWPLLEKMLLVRRFEEAVLRLSDEKRFIGHYHLYIGQEATGVTLISLLEPRDRLATTHRNHAAGPLISTLHGVAPTEAAARLVPEWTVHYQHDAP